MRKTNVVVLGSTGSIGLNTLKIIERFPDRFAVVGLSAFNNVDLLIQQVRKFSPRRVAVGAGKIARLRRDTAGGSLKIFDADKEIAELVAPKDVDIVVLGIQGSAALTPFLAAIRLGKRIAPANKEALVMAGGIIMPEAKRFGAQVIPVDSEQSAIFQCLEGHRRADLKRIYLTASGGPLRDVARSRFGAVTLKTVLNHPRWKMGKKITVDSATLMNKGLEVIEAMWLFGLVADEVKVVIHPESIIHSMVEFCDGAIIAQLGITDMRIPIQYALTYPERLATRLPALDLVKQRQLTFGRPPMDKFPALALCFWVARQGKTYGSVLNAANEETVAAFLKGRVRFSQIPDIVEKVVRRHRPQQATTIERILDADRWAREEARRLMGA